MKKLKEIEKKLKAEVEKNPDNPEAHFKLGVFNFNMRMKKQRMNVGRL